MVGRRAWVKPWVVYPFGCAILVIVIVVVYYFCYHPVTTVILVRHAEKATTQPQDPPLSATGIARAETLVHVVGEAGVAAVFATQYLRTIQTVQPVVNHLGLPVNQVDADDVAGLVDQVLSDYAGEVVLIAGHSNTIPLIIEELGGDPISPIAASEYDNILIVFKYRYGKAKVLNLKYGNPS